jgi:dCMP deaminase
MLKWRKRFLRLAREVSTWSRDPSTKVGCVIVDPQERRPYLSYNGFPVTHSDDPELYADREYKYKNIIHAEMNGIIGRDVKGMDLYVYPFFCCSNCAKHVAQAGVKNVYSCDLTPERWKSDVDLSKKIFIDNKVEFTIFKPEFLEADITDTTTSNPYIVTGWWNPRY